MSDVVKAGYKRTEVGVIAEDWEVKRLGEVCEIGMGRTPPRLNQALWGRGHVWHRVLTESTQRSDSAVFIEFMLERLLEAIAQHTATGTDSSVTDPVADPFTDPVDQVLRELASGPLAPSMILSRLGLRHRPTFRSNYLRPALEGKWIEMTLPNKPNSRLQKYRLTAAGQVRLKAIARPGNPT